MEFEDIWCCVKSKKKTAFAHDSIGHWHWTLRGVRGKVCAPRSLCVLGPSGSGKTTLLAALGMQLQHSSTRWITGKLKVPEHSIAYVPQDTPFFSNLTVRETLNFAAKMESRRGEDIEPKVDYVTRKLGLGHCVNTLVGGDLGGHFVRGISGGERRRLAIACEMLRTYCAEPEEMTVLIADEPTTGLDAFQADKVIENLLSIAHEKEALVVMCIHQPRSAIYNKLDDIMLLGPGGYTCYTGDAQEAVKYFETMGYKCPDMHNPAEFLIDLVSIDTSSVQSEKESWQRIISLSEAWKSKGPSLRNLNASTRSEANKSQSDESAFMQSDSKKKRLGILSQIGLLVKRNFIQASREKYIHTTRAIGTIILGLAFGSCHPKLGFGQKSIQRRAAVMLQVCINSSMMATIKTLNSFPKERAVVRKELAKKRKDGSSAYSVGSYFLSKLLIESPIDAFFPVLFGSVVAPLSGLNRKMRWPFLGTLALQGISASSVGMSIGAFAPNTETALAIGPVVMVLSIMLGDSNGVFAEVPNFLKPAAEFSVIKWGFDGCMGSEFSGLEFVCDLGETGIEADDKAGKQGGILDFFSKTRKSNVIAKEVAKRMCVSTGKEVLEGMNLDENCVARAAKKQGRLIFVNLLATYFLLSIQEGKGKGVSKNQFSNRKTSPIPLRSS